jgi:hypothetical protein
MIKLLVQRGRAREAPLPLITAGRLSMPGKREFAGTIRSAQAEVSFRGLLIKEPRKAGSSIILPLQPLICL